MGFVVFSLFNIIMGLSSRTETGTVFNRDIFTDRRQLMLYGLALLLTFLPTELGFTQRMLGLTSLSTGNALAALHRLRHCPAAGGRSDQVLHAQASRRHSAATPVVAAPAQA